MSAEVKPCLHTVQTFTGQSINVGDEVVYLKNLRTGSSTIRKCKCTGVVRKIKGQNIDVECLSAEASYFKEVAEVHRVCDNEVICILGKTVEGVHAEWLDIRFDSMWRSMLATCSHCKVRGEVRVKSNECGFAVPDSDYCPHCGAKMNGGINK